MYLSQLLNKYSKLWDIDLDDLEFGYSALMLGMRNIQVRNKLNKDARHSIKRGAFNKFKTNIKRLKM